MGHQRTEPDSQPTDEHLAREVANGRREALNLLVVRHLSQLMGYLYRMTGGDRTLAEDMAQESFLRLLHSIRQYQYPRPFKPYLYAIASNLVRDHFRTADYRHTDALPVEGLAQQADEDDGPEAGLIADQESQHDIRRVVNALRALPTHQREAVILRYYQEWELSAIAEALAIPVGTVKSRLSLGLKRLRVLLETPTAEMDQR